MTEIEISFMGNYLVASYLASWQVASQVASYIVLIEYTIFTFYTTKIRLEILQLATIWETSCLTKPAKRPYIILLLLI